MKAFLAKNLREGKNHLHAGSAYVNLKFFSHQSNRREVERSCIPIPALQRLRLGREKPSHPSPNPASLGAK
jgi:hypothetical protein